MQLLIPTDFSQNAWNATVYAFQFFKNEKISFHFLHIDIWLRSNRDEELHYAGLSTRKEVSRETKAAMKAWMKQVRSTQSYPIHTYKQTIVQAPFIDGIREYSQKNGIDLMVMGTKGASGLKEMTIGSRTGAVIIKVKCPVLVIPEDAKFKMPLNIGFPTDFNLLYRDRILRTLIDVANIHRSSIKVLRVAQNEKSLDNFQSNNRDLLKQEFSAISHSFHVIENPNLENALQSFVTTMQIDMVAMIAKNLNFFQRILFRPQVTKISYHMHIPFLVLHE